MLRSLNIHIHFSNFVILTVSVLAAHRWVFSLHGPSLDWANKEGSGPQIQHPSVHRESNNYKMGQFSVHNSWICACLDVWGRGQGSNAKGIQRLPRHTSRDWLHRAALPNTILSPASRWRVPALLQGVNWHSTAWCSHFCVILVCRICQWQWTSEAVWDCVAPETWNGHYGRQRFFCRWRCTMQSLQTCLPVQAGRVPS